METLLRVTEFTFSPQTSPLACFTDASSPRVVTALAGRVGSFPDLCAASYRQMLKHASATRDTWPPSGRLVQSLSRLLLLKGLQFLNGARFIYQPCKIVSYCSSKYEIRDKTQFYLKNSFVTSKQLFPPLNLSPSPDIFSPIIELCSFLPQTDFLIMGLKKDTS